MAMKENSSLGGSAEVVDLTGGDFLAGKTRPNALYIGTSGDLTVVLRDDEDDQEVTFVGIPAGFAPISVKKILDTSTAADIILLR